MDADVDNCKKNDKYGLYKQADEGKIKYLPGVDEDYDVPQTCDFTIKSGKNIDIEVIVSTV